MFAIIGATGNVGHSTSSALRKTGLPVRAIVRDEAKASRLKEIGCEIVVADLQNSIALAKAIEGANAVQVILPLRPQLPNPADDLHQSGASVIEALEQSNVNRALVISDYGAHVPEDIGMPSVFRKFEAEFRELGGQRIILRTAEYMHNWGRVIPQAISSGTLPSFQEPVDKLQPAIFAPDLGLISAQLLMRSDGADGTTVAHAEGPHRYSAADVAAAISQLSGRPITAKAIPRSEWCSAMSKMPPDLASLLSKAEEAKNKGNLVDVEPNVGEVFHGQTELIEGLRPLLNAK